MDIILSIIIVSYKNIKDLDECLDSIYKSNDLGDGLEVTVVDHTPDITLYKTISRKFESRKNFKILRHENKGFGSGNNFGAANSHGKYLLFLNPDTILIEPIFKSAIDFYEKNKAGIIGFQLLDIHKNKNKSFDWIYHSSFLKRFIMMKYYWPNGIYKYKEMYTEGADIFISKEIFEKAGAFDENIFMYYEETDLFLRVINLGLQNFFDKDLHIIHKEGGSTYEADKAVEKRLKSLEYVSKKHGFDFDSILRKEINMTKFRLHFIKDEKEKLSFTNYLKALKDYK